MSEIVLVRHGQVADFQTDGDRLSHCGREQARALANYWIDRGISFTEAYCGALGRHRETAACVADAYTQRGLTFPDRQADQRWNEYDARGVMGDLRHENPKAFQRALEAAMLEWLAGRATEIAEPWTAFRDRIRAALDAIVSPTGTSRRALVFTSGGPIGLAVQTSMSAPDRAFLDLNWRLRNCSTTGFVFGAGRLTLDYFNSTAHLAPDLLTWR